MKQGNNVYWVEYRDSVYDEMDDFKKVIAPEIKTGAKSFSEFLILFTNITLKHHVRISDILHRTSSSYDRDYKSEYDVGDYALELTSNILQEDEGKKLKGKLSVETLADMNKAYEHLKELMRSIVTEDKDFIAPAELPKANLILTSQLASSRYGCEPRTMFTMDVKPEENIIVKKLRVKKVEEFNEAERENYKKMLQKIDVALPYFQGSNKADNDFRAFITELEAEAVRTGKKKEEESTRHYRSYYSYDTDSIRAAIDANCPIGSMSAINDLYRTVNEISALSLEVRKRFRLELAQYLIALDHPLYSLQMHVNVPSSVINKKNKEAANGTTK